MPEKKKKKYKKPEIKFEKKMEAFAATCIGNPLAKSTPGAPNGFGQNCEPQYLYS